MSEQHWIEFFNHDVDDMLRGIEPPDRVELPLDYHQGREFVRSLSAVDFSVESTVRRDLRQRLLNRILSDHQHSIQEHRMFTIFRQRRWVTGMALAVVVIIALLASPLGTTIAQAVVNIVQSWQVGEQTVIHAVDSDFQLVPNQNGEATFLPAEQTAPIPEEDFTPGVRPVNPQIDFTVREPSYVPEGYTLTALIVSSPNEVVLQYEKPYGYGAFGILQRKVDASNPATIGITADILVEDVSINGQPGVWMTAAQPGEDGEHMLVWEVDGVSYQLQGTIHELEEALRIAESLK
jgi:hypothetical protein